MLNHTYTSVKNANIVDCGRKQHISSQPIPLLRDKYLGEYRTELDKKKVLVNLGIATDLSLEWEYIKGDIGRSESLMKELDSRTKYISKIDGFKKTVLEGISYLETVVGGEQEGEEKQDERLSALEEISTELTRNIQELKIYIQDNIEINLEELNTKLNTISEKVENITELIKVSTKEGNALLLISEESEEDGLYVPDLAPTLTQATTNIEGLRTDVNSILDTYVTKDDLGGGSFDFVEQQVFDSYKSSTDQQIININQELNRTVKTGEDGHVDTLYVNTISKDNDNGHIKITDSFEVETGIPLDVRFVVETLEDLLSLNPSVCYSGMGVIVNSLSSLYILRKTDNITQEYISDVFNWKCPEDLVTVALTREAYDNLEEINPNVFYYIYEDEITRTKEPKREDYLTEEEFQTEWQKWVESLKTLSQEYMSASWGIEIEEKISAKASNTLVSGLNEEIEKLNKTIQDISGGEGADSLSSLSTRLTSTEEDLKYLLGTEGSAEEPTVKGKISEIEESINGLGNKIVSEFVTIESITNESPDVDYIFVKKSDYETDKESHETAISNQVKTKQVVTDELSLSELSVTSNGADLLLNNKEVALLEEVPKIEYLLQSEYDKKVAEGTIDPEVYYYTTDELSYVTNKELEDAVEKLNVLLQSLATDIQTLKTDISDIKARLSTLESNS